MIKGQNNTFKYPKIINFLGTGKEHGINQPALCELMGCAPTELKAEVQRFRRENKDHSLFICSDKNGYYIAKDKTEIKEFVSLLSKQAASRYETIREAKRILEETEGQVEIDGMGV